MDFKKNLGKLAMWIFIIFNNDLDLQSENSIQPQTIIWIIWTCGFQTFMALRERLKINV